MFESLKISMYFGVVVLLSVYIKHEFFFFFFASCHWFGYYITSPLCHDYHLMVHTSQSYYTQF